MTTLKQVLNKLNWRRKRDADSLRVPNNGDMEKAFEIQCHCTDEEYMTRQLYEVAGFYNKRISNS